MVMALCKLDEERRTLRDSASIMVIDFFLREENGSNWSWPESSSVESVRKSVASLVLWTDAVLHSEVGHMVNQKRKEWQAGRGCHEFIDTLELATP